METTILTILTTSRTTNEALVARVHSLMSAPWANLPGRFLSAKEPAELAAHQTSCFLFFMWHQDHDLFQRFLFAYFNFNS